MAKWGLSRIVSELKIRRRTRLKRKQSIALREDFAAVFGEVALWGDDAAVETADVDGQEVIIVDQTIFGLRDDAGPFLSLRGLLAYRPESRFVTVDMGAVKFVHNGADVMAPGIVAADEALAEGDWCWVRDEKNHQPLGIGKCLVPGSKMVGATGKAVKSMYIIGDKLWELDA